MKNIILFLIPLLSLNFYSQNLSEINSDLNLTDSLTYETEVRIYQGGGITNYSSLLRMFKDKSEKWTAEFHEHYAIVVGQVELRTEKQTLKSKNDMEFVFQNLTRSHILDLPNESEINWKLVTHGNIEKVERNFRGKKIEEYEFSQKKIAILDGEGFKIQVTGWGKNNEFEYSNPDGYLKHYPEIDELIYMCEILNIIRHEFGIWKN
ncbi:hypothetical protein [uncultured Aquimarina sp.]|uniref:hypothetical protein n=1 Tax=uncultured Aquimarina sp. TaxID=575652 RepID=UPI002609C748|nr:hypothetical protein [uncultured Aquimarina sp.]